MKKTSKRTLTALMAAMILATTSVVAAIPVFAAETQSVSSEQQTASVAIDEKNFPDVYRSKVRICSPNKIADPDFWSMWQKWRVYA